MNETTTVGQDGQGRGWFTLARFAYILLYIVSIVVTIVFTIVYWNEGLRLSALYYSVVTGMSLAIRTFRSVFFTAFRAVRRVGRLAAQIFESVLGVTVGLFGNLATFVRLILRNLRVAVNVGLTYVAEQVAPALLRLLATVYSVQFGLSGVIATFAIRLQVQIFIGFIGIIVRLFKFVYQQLVNIFGNLINLISEALIEAWITVCAAFESAINDLNAFWVSSVEPLVHTMANLLTPLGHAFDSILNVFKEFYCIPCVACNQIPAGVFRDACYAAVSPLVDCGNC